MTPPPRRGLTMIEGLICIAVLLIAVSAALPGFGAARDQRRVEGAAAQLETDLQLTRGLAVSQNRTVRFEIPRNGEGTCYVIHNGAAGACTCAAGGLSCRAGTLVHRSQHFPSDAGVAGRANVVSLGFDPVKGTVTPTGTLRIEGRNAALHQVVNIMGRPRTCSPGGSVPGYPSC